MPILLFIGFSCYRCGHEWVPEKLIRAEEKNYKMPRVCAGCKSPYYQVPREKDILSVINSGMFQSYETLIPLTVFVKSHIKAGDDAVKILDCIMSLPVTQPANPKKWLEEKFQDVAKT